MCVSHLPRCSGKSRITNGTSNKNSPNMRTSFLYSSAAALSPRQHKKEHHGEASAGFIDSIEVAGPALESQTFRKMNLADMESHYARACFYQHAHAKGSEASDLQPRSHDALHQFNQFPRRPQEGCGKALRLRRTEAQHFLSLWLQRRVLVSEEVLRVQEI